MQMREGTVVLWRAAPGERVEKGGPLLVIESDKAEVDVEAPASGVVRHVYVVPGATVPCGTLLAALSADPAEPFDPEAFRAAHGPAPQGPPAPGSRAADAPAGLARARASASSTAPITPAARRRAQELGVDLALVAGSGPGGRVLREDVEALAARLAARVEVAPGVRLAVEEAGRGPEILLLPGFGSDASSFARAAPVLAERRRTRIVQPRGVGGSDAPAGSAHDVAEAARDAAALLGPEGAHVLGVSVGAAVALALALGAPGKVRSLTLVTPLVAADGRLRAVLEGWAALAAEAAPALVAGALAPWLFSGASLGDPLRRARLQRGLAETAARCDAAALASRARAVAAYTTPPAATLAALRMPILVVQAGDDLLTPSARELISLLPQARSILVPGAGHALLVEAPEAALPEITAHLDRAERGEGRRDTDGREEVTKPT